MKKVLFPILIMGAGVALNAQKIEVSASYGIPSVYGVAHDFASSIVGAITDTKTPSSNGVAAVGVMIYNKDMKWRYGVDFTSEFYDKTESISKQNMISILPRVDYFWLNKGKLGLYSGGSIGMNFMNTTYVDKDKKENKNTDSGLGFNVVPIGLKYGGALSIFVESNVGMKGILQAGAAYRF
ncbi:hypothetical protein [Chryseobacterium sp. PMSZPI]|uniref:hypothetical protein n=1 Tax=Chryseobacterium sp. PMSZPI TaxID=1033900 RepID=UPI000C328372|nr:hypothetical protein [Chryseobacterium sp. PMSZPI]PKF73721.1 hypothetical protein CW752_12920 [Chryseobacterium sp. PMSZPI]